MSEIQGLPSAQPSAAPNADANLFSSLAQNAFALAGAPAPATPEAAPQPAGPVNQAEAQQALAGVLTGVAAMGYDTTQWQPLPPPAPEPAPALVAPDAGVYGPPAPAPQSALQQLGWSEGQAQAYMAANPDLGDAAFVGFFGAGAEGAAQHYLQFGRNEGRPLAPPTPQPIAAAVAGVAAMGLDTTQWQPTPEPAPQPAGPANQAEAQQALAGTLTGLAAMGVGTAPYQPVMPEPAPERRAAALPMDEADGGIRAMSQVNTVLLPGSNYIPRLPNGDQVPLLPGNWPIDGTVTDAYRQKARENAAEFNARAGTLRAIVVEISAPTAFGTRQRFLGIAVVSSDKVDAYVASLQSFDNSPANTTGTRIENSATLYADSNLAPVSLQPPAPTAVLVTDPGNRPTNRTSDEAFVTLHEQFLQEFYRDVDALGIDMSDLGSRNLNDPSLTKKQQIALMVWAYRDAVIGSRSNLTNERDVYEDVRRFVDEHPCMADCNASKQSVLCQIYCLLKRLFR